MYMIISILILILLYYLTKWNKKYKKYLIYTNILVCIVYIIWRYTVLPTDTWSGVILGILLYIAEIMGLWQFFFMQYIFSKEYSISKVTLDVYDGNLPTVDVFICTYNEPIRILEKTIIGALNLIYDRDKLNIYVCDDGKRQDVEKLCKLSEVQYITRDENTGAKAGNINHALSITKGELFVVLDADMVCTKHFLSKTVGYFSELKMAFVQTPQVFYNKDMYQRNLKKDIPNEQDFFMRDIQEGRAAIDAVLHVGTNAVFRRKYVEEIGLYPTNTITEDMAVGMQLQEKGLISIFINEALVLGLSASTYVDLARQRDRWCRGNMQVVKHYKPFRKSNLNFRQKLAYFDGTLYWFTSFQKMIYILCPLWFLVTTQRSINTPITQLIQIFLPYFMGLLLIYKSIVPDTRTLKWAHIYDVAMAPHMCISIIKEIFSSKKKFVVTTKEIKEDKSYFQFYVVMPHMIIVILSILSWIVGVIYLKYSIISLSAYTINMIWSIYNFIAVFICIRTAYHIANTESTEYADIEGGHPAKFKIESQMIEGTILSVSEYEMIAKINNLQNDMIGTKIIVMMEEEDQESNIHAEVKEIKKGIVKMYYSNLNFQQKRVILSIYIDHLKPAYDVKRKQNYV